MQIKSLIKAGLLGATLAGLAVPAFAQSDQGDKDKGSQSDHRGGGNGRGGGGGGGGGDHGGRSNDGGGRPAPAAVPAPPAQAPVVRAAPPTPTPAPAPVVDYPRRQGDGGRNGYGYVQRGGPSPSALSQVQQPAPPQAPQTPDRRGFTGDQGRSNGNWQGNGGNDRPRDARDGDRRGDNGRDRNWNDNRGNGDNFRQPPRPPANARPPVANRWNGVRRWDNQAWRNDRRYNWQSWRYSHRDLFHLPRYYAPYGWDWGYTRFSTDSCLDDLLFGDSYWIGDPWTYHLPPTYGPLHWVRYYNDALLVDVRDGCVVDAVYDLFW